LLSWLTVERAAYLGIALLALALRLVNLGAHPLSDAEAQQALVAWHVHQAQPADPVGYSPLIGTLNLLNFALLGGSEFAARLGPALLSVTLVLLPYGLRHHLGRAGALATAALFAISPTALYLSRTVNGDIAAAVGGLALVVGLFGWLDWLDQSGNSHLQPATSSLYLAAGGLVLLLTASPASYTALALLLGFLALAAGLGSQGYATSARQGLAALRARPEGWSNLGLFLAIGLVAAATGLLFNPGGLAASADLLTTWLLGFVPPTRGFAPTTGLAGVYPALFLLTLYEPLILLAGLFGVSAGLLRRRLFDLLLVWWFFGSIALNLLRTGRTGGEVLLPLIPLTLLAGLALGMLWDSLRAEGNWQKEGIILVTGLVISGYAYVSLMQYTRTGGLTLWLPVAGIGLFVVLAVLFGIWYDWASSLRGAALAAVVALTLFSVASGSRLNYQRLADPHQPLVRTSPAEGLPKLLATLEQVSSWRTGDPYLVDLVADRRLGPAVEWQLRRFQNVTWVDRLDQLAAGTSVEDSGTFLEGRRLDDFAVILAPALVPVASDKGYAGQDFAIRASWSPAGLTGQTLIRWIMLRTASTPANLEQAVLWVEQPPAAQTAQEPTTSGESVR
jgi:4-amino-4-deoxy-L-arabinose transferase-like glycosyltransferase